MSRRTVVAALAIGALAAALIVLVQWLRTTSTPENDGVASGSVEGSDPAPIPTSEELIAVALKAGDMTHEESLLARAYALFDDPRLEPAFRSPVVNWEAGSRLFDEIERQEGTLSDELLATLEPFRVRPSNPRSIVNRPRAEIVPAQLLSQEELNRRHQEFLDSERKAWSDRLVPGTNVRIWIRGTPAELNRFAPMVRQVWDQFPSYFPYPLPDNGPGPISQFNPNAYQFNPDSAIDLYFMNAGALDPRCAERFGGPHLCRMTIGTGVAVTADARPQDAGVRRTSGYSLVDVDQPDHILTDTIAHEIAHASQRQYDSDERGTSSWMMESTATWVAFKVVKDLDLEPTYEYGKLDTERFFRTLNRSLPRVSVDYSSYLFFYHASLELGNRIVQRIWERAAQPNVDGIRAVSAAIPLDEHFPRFAVRNWNQDGLVEPWRYKSSDDSFPSSLRPSDVIHVRFAGPANEELTQPVPGLGARYYRFTFDASIRRVTFENLFVGQQHAHVWALRKIGDSDWKEPEDWTKETVKAFCRDEATENVTELVVIISNTELVDEDSVTGGRRVPDFPQGPRPIVLAEDVGCPVLEGWAESTLRLKDDTQDVTYRSSRASLRFRPRTVQDQAGNVQYDLLPTSVTWTVAGTRHGCRLTGQAVVTIPGFVDLPLDPSRPAYGYLNVVGQDGGDFHSVQVSAIDPAARMTVTCPGDPPRVSREPFTSVWLLHILQQANTHDSNTAVFKGTQTLDPARFQDNLPQAARDLLQGNPPQTGTGTPRTGLGAPAPGTANLPGTGLNMPTFGNLPGIDPAAIEVAMQQARDALQQADLQGGRVVYTFQWELKPAAGPPPGN